MKKYLVLFAFLLLAPQAHASTQVIISMEAPQSNTTQSWSPLSGGNATLGRAASLPNIATIVSAAGTISGLAATSTIALTGTQTWEASYYKNGVKQALLCTVSASGMCTDSNAAHNFAVVAGDTLQVSMIPANTPNSGIQLSVAINFTPTTDGDTLVMSDQDAAAPSNSVNNFTTLGYFRTTYSTSEASTSAAASQTYWPDGGTFGNLYYSNNATAAGAAKSLTINLRKNQATGNLSVVIDNAGGGKANDTTHSDTVAVGDLLDFQTVPAGTPSTQTHGAGLKFVSNTNGNFVLLGGNWNTVSGASFFGVSSQTGSSTEPGAQEISKAMTFKSFVVMCAAAPGAAKTATITLRVNAVNTALACTLSGAGTGATFTQCTATGSVAIADNDMLDYGYTTTGAPSGTNCQVNAVGNNSTVVASVIHGMVWINLGVIQLITGVLNIL